MKPPLRTRITAWAVALVVIAVIVGLVIYLPIVAAAIFVLGVTLAAIGVAKEKGKLKGALFFVKEMLFGW